MAEKELKHEKKSGEGELGEPFKSVKKMKTAELVEAMGNKLTEVIKTLNANTEMANKRFETVESNQTELTKILAQMRQNPGFSIGTGPGGERLTTKEKMTYGIIDLVLKGEGSSSPIDQAFKMAESFNKIYMSGQTNMLRMMQIMTKRGSVKELLGDEGEGE